MFVRAYIHRALNVLENHNFRYPFEIVIIMNVYIPWNLQLDTINVILTTKRTSI